MVRFAAAAVMVLVPLLWGYLMVPVMGFFEKKILMLLQKSNK